MRRTAITVATVAALAALAGCGSDTAPVTDPTTHITTSPTTATPAPDPTASATAKPATTVTMPNVVGQNAAVAQDTLKKLGFAPGRIELGSVDPDDRMVILAQNWTVKKQSVKAGAKVRTDTLVVLSCTKN